ncbi:hypothetical protein [Ammoniphilus sp. CFH 90114]|uniref:hypothetical protein n=1 Tax=Ammoniphilus sp. CFH 90114 TaxID=2493665 RepID=UPI00100ECF2E|nr:hypothetical protein [Ammoniphilus sp. CFH 90114]RXT00989.1 hypothetical protein EIZ39_25695 [Ammoniphilus sp. CFH 90114]
MLVVIRTVQVLVVPCRACLSFGLLNDYVQWVYLTTVGTGYLLAHQDWRYIVGFSRSNDIRLSSIYAINTFRHPPERGNGYKINVDPAKM